MHIDNRKTKSTTHPFQTDLWLLSMNSKLVLSTLPYKDLQCTPYTPYIQSSPDDQWMPELSCVLFACIRFLCSVVLWPSQTDSLSVNTVWGRECIPLADPTLPQVQELSVFKHQEIKSVHDSYAGVCVWVWGWWSGIESCRCISESGS